MENGNVPDLGKGELNSAMHFFLYLVLFLSLGFVVFGTGFILFQFINNFFPDPLSDSFWSGYDQGAVKFGIAALFVAAPIFFTLMRLVTKYISNGTIPENSRVRRWLTYIVLFFAAGTMIGDLINLVVSFLEGDIAAKTLLKILVILILAGSVFGYYFWNIRKKNMVGVIYRENRFVGWGAAGIVFVIFVSSFFIIDSPTVAREKKIDGQTVLDLQSVDSAVHEYFNTVGELPGNLDDLKKGSFSPTIHPASGLTYDKSQAAEYVLCATFIRSDKQEAGATISQPFAPTGQEWIHDSGKVCFSRIIEKQSMIR